MVKIGLQKPDIMGATASILCVIHCISTPYLFIVHSCALGGCQTSPNWWRSLDYIFLLISFISIRYSVKNTSKEFMKKLLWSSWAILCLLILNEEKQLILLPEILTHITAFSLSLLHLYNMKYCQCTSNKCCI